MVQWCQSTTNDDLTLSATEFGAHELAQKFGTGIVFENEYISQTTFYLKHKGTPATGTINAHIRESDGSLKNTSSTNYSASGLTGTSQPISFLFTGAGTQFDLTNMITISSTDLSEEVAVFSVSPTVTANTNLMHTSSPGSGYSEYTNNQTKQCVTYSDVPSTTATRFPPPPIVLGGL